MAEFPASIELEQAAPDFTREGVAVTYTQKSDSLSLTTGTVTESDTDTVIAEVLVSDLMQKTVRDSNEKYQIGDRLFVIRNADMPETPPKNTSVLTYDSTDHKIITHIKSSDLNEWHIVGRKV